MRLLRLELERLRHFRDAALPLAEGRALSVVYGPNEAGKTTVLEAIRCFLFGFRDKSAELTLDFEQSELRVGALLELDNGRALRATRTKGRKQTLFGEALQGGEEFDDEWLSARLSRPSRAVFENVFAFSLEMLARGAESLKEHEVRTAIYGAGFGGNVDLARLLRTSRASARRSSRRAGRCRASTSSRGRSTSGAASSGRRRRPARSTAARRRSSRANARWPRRSTRPRRSSASRWSACAR